MENNNENMEKDKDRDLVNETRSRPVSFYENSYSISTGNERIKNEKNSNNSTKGSGDPHHTESPSLTFCLMTTVPQSITAQNLGGKHTPTRNSLRHSRMIVLNRNGRVPAKYLPVMVRYHGLTKLLLILITVLGSSLCLLSLWLLLWSPNVQKRYNPYWSGIPVVVSGIIGMVLLCKCPKEYPGRKLSGWFYSVKYISVTTSTAAAIAAFVVFILAAIHIIFLATVTCQPPDKLNTTCICKTNLTTESSFFVQNNSYHYVDLTCYEVKNTFSYLLIFSCVTNGTVFLLEILYLYLHWTSRYSYIYSKVPLNDTTTVSKNGNSFR